jgi:hypothetical protein
MPHVVLPVAPCMPCFQASTALCEDFQNCILKEFHESIRSLVMTLLALCYDAFVECLCFV